MVIISGASQGIGEFLLKRYVSSGEKVTGLFNRTSPQNFTEAYLKLDVRDEDQVTEFASETDKDSDGLTLINCAGINQNAVAHKADVEAWRQVIDTNLLGTFNMIRAFLPIMRETGYGRIINFSSVVALRATPGVSAYAASKSALTGLVKSIMAENASHGITINNINLGYSNLGMISQVPDKYLDEIRLQIPSRELCDSEDIFRTVEYIRATKYLNGTSINLTGGLE